MIDKSPDASNSLNSPLSSDAKNDAAYDDVATRSKILDRYIKNFSFKNPNVVTLIANPGQEPKIRAHVEASAGQIRNDLFETSIEVKALATCNLCTMYSLEMIYAGLIEVDRLPDRELRRALLISAPTIIYPFVRRLVARFTHVAGFHPLRLQPIDFEKLYMRGR